MCQALPSASVHSSDKIICKKEKIMNNYNITFLIIVLVAIRINQVIIYDIITSSHEEHLGFIVSA
jgi:hypothetical protein